MRGLGFRTRSLMPSLQGGKSEQSGADRNVRAVTIIATEAVVIDPSGSWIGSGELEVTGERLILLIRALVRSFA